MVRAAATGAHLLLRAAMMRAPGVMRAAAAGVAEDRAAVRDEGLRPASMRRARQAWGWLGHVRMTRLRVREAVAEAAAGHASKRDPESSGAGRGGDRRGGGASYHDAG